MTQAMRSHHTPERMPAVTATAHCKLCRAIVPTEPLETDGMLGLSLVCQRCGGPVADVRLRRLR